MRLYGLSKRASKLHGAACGICQNRPTARQGRARARREAKAETVLPAEEPDERDEGEMTPEEWRAWWAGFAAAVWPAD